MSTSHAGTLIPTEGFICIAHAINTTALFTWVCLNPNSLSLPHSVRLQFVNPLSHSFYHSRKRLKDNAASDWSRAQKRRCRHQDSPWPCLIHATSSFDSPHMAVTSCSFSYASAANAPWPDF